MKDLNRHFTEEEIQMTNKHMKRCSTSLVIKEMQFEITMWCHFMPTRMAIVQKIGKDREKLEPSHTAGGNVKWYRLFGKQFL